MENLIPLYGGMGLSIKGDLSVNREDREDRED